MSFIKLNNPKMGDGESFISLSTIEGVVWFKNGTLDEWIVRFSHDQKDYQNYSQETHLTEESAKARCDEITALLTKQPSNQKDRLFELYKSFLKIYTANPIDNSRTELFQRSYIMAKGAMEYFDVMENEK